MCNCNQKRAMLISHDDHFQKGMVKTVLLENNPLVINGDITGRMYIFRKSGDVNWVDKRDIIGIKSMKALKIYT